MIHRIKHAVFALAFLLAEPVFALNEYIRIPEGDVAALKNGLLSAQNEVANTTVLLVGGDYRFTAEDGLPEIGNKVSILADQGPTRFLGTNGGPATLLRVTESGSLRLSNVSLEEFDLGVMPQGGGEAGLIVNRGELNLVQMQFRNNTTQVSCSGGSCSAYKPLVVNTETGDLRVAFASIVNSGAIAAQGFGDSESGAVVRSAGTGQFTNVQLYLSGQPYEPPLRNTGDMRLRNVSFQFDSASNRYEREFIVSPGRLQVSNSVLAGFASGWCDSVISAGYNVVDNPDCRISSREDVVGKSGGLLWLPIDARWIGRGGEEILTHALVPSAASPAVDSANPDWCPNSSLHDAHSFPVERDRSLDGDGDGVARCDRGSFEIAKNVVQAGGINGLYFNPDADGHYVYIADTRFNTMVMWTTFDSNRRQVWIFGIADNAVAGRSLIADAYINRDGRVSLSGQFDPATSEPWGRIEVEMTSCDEGHFSFISDDPGFPSGRFEITRLAHVKRLGCVNFPGGG